MPLVRIDAIAQQDATATANRLKELGDAVHHALIETLGIPTDDYFQILNAHADGLLRYDPGYLGIRRDDEVAFVSITLRSKRTDAQKTALYRRITELASEQVGIEPRNVLIALTENELVDWSFGDGVAQYIA